MLSELLCPLCERLKGGGTAADFLFEGDSLLFFRGPFWNKWPGHVMAVYKEHICEMSDSRKVAVLQNELLMAESAVRRVTMARRMNVVKFGNVCEHLHFHLIPRYEGETESTKCSWELLEVPPKNLYKKQIPVVSSTALSEEIFQSYKTAKPGYFSATFLLRPATWGVADARDLSWTLEEAIRGARADPRGWECLLMRRNYGDYGWDHFGGCAESGEFPEITLRREIYEELGWRLGECLEVTRQWQRGVLRGFVFVSSPCERGLLHPNEPRPASGEAAECRYFTLHELVKDEKFNNKIRVRTEAFLAGNADCEIFK